MLCAVGGHEIRPHVVVGAPYVDVIDERIGDLGGGNESQGSVLVTVEYFGEAAFATSSAIIEPACEAVVRHDVGEIGVSQSFDIADAITGLAPNLFCTVVSVLDDEGSLVDGLVH